MIIKRTFFGKYKIVVDRKELETLAEIIKHGEMKAQTLAHQYLHAGDGRQTERYYLSLSNWAHEIFRRIYSLLDSQ